jgi:HTH-type transcriptional regulator/antitoxin MqsA
MKCPTCGIGKLVTATRDAPYTYKGKSTIIKAVKGQYCDNPKCGEIVMEMGESVRTSGEMLAFNKTVNAKLTPIHLLPAVRRRFNLTQQQAAKVFGGGPNAFSRYESGKTKPPLTLVQLFKVLDKHPDLFEEVASVNAETRQPEKRRHKPLTAGKLRAPASQRKRRTAAGATHA